MKIKQTHTGILVNEKEVIEITLQNNQGTLVSIFNYGTIIHRFVVQNKQGKMQDIVLGFDDFNGYISDDYLANYCYFGAIIGRYANRIKNGQFAINETIYQSAQNQGNDCLHGGIEGFDKKVWDILETTAAPHPKVIFQYISKDGEEGFPGNLTIQLSFTLTENNALVLDFKAQTDKTTAINLTHHSYFNLSPSLQKIKQHQLQINAAYYLQQDDNYVVTGKLLPVKNTNFDFTKPKNIAHNWNEQEGYDQTFVLDKNSGQLALAGAATEENSGLSLQFYTTEPVAHLYTAKYLSVKNGKGGKHYSEFDAFCVETQHHPNGINIPDFPTTILPPQKVYHQQTIYQISKI